MNSQKNIRLTKKLISIKKKVPAKEFRDYILIVRNFVLIETPEEFIFEALKYKLENGQIRRLIDYELERDRLGRKTGIMRIINAEFPKELVEQAKHIESKEISRKYYAANRTRLIKRNIRNREWRKIVAETESQMSKVKSRKKPKETFWKVSAKTDKYKPNKWKM